MSQGSDAGRQPGKDFSLMRELRTDRLLEGNFSPLQQPAKCTSDVKMQFSALNADIQKAGVSGSCCNLIGTSFCKPISKSCFYSKYQPNWLLGRSGFVEQKEASGA